MVKLDLPGCTSEPLMGYLKALGLFRIIAEQADQKATLAWREGHVQLHSKLDREGLTQFFLNDYRPTPILAPWNGGSGFYSGGSEPLKEIRASTSNRFTLYRESIKIVDNLVLKTKPADDDKTDLLIRCRAKLPDEMVPWLDTCFVLEEEGQKFFPLLGTGGNDGRLDFTNNFMQRLEDVVSFDENGQPPKQSADWLQASLFADTLVELGKTAIGQFNPGGIGGANGTQGDFEADSKVNPWDFVLMIEGVLLFAGSVARRLGANATSKAIYPFSVESVAVGYGSATVSEETTDGSRSEVWLPIWEVSISLLELKQLFAEGRAQLGRKQAKNAVEFALAISLLGVSRGISSFVRYGFLKRNGLAFLATPLGRIEVTLRPSAQLLNDPELVRWLDRLRLACRDKERTPARYQTALRQIDRAIFAYVNMSERGKDPEKRALLEVLRKLGQAERTLANGLGFCKEKFLSPLQKLSAQWLDQANDGSAEFALAMSLAGIRPAKSVGIIRTYLEEVEAGPHWAKWSPGSKSTVWSKQSLSKNLVDVFKRRQLEAFQNGEVVSPSESNRSAPVACILEYLLDPNFDDDKFHDLLWALVAIDWSTLSGEFPSRTLQPWTSLPTEYALPRLLLISDTLKCDSRQVGWTIEASKDPDYLFDPQPFQTLMSSRQDAIGEAVDQSARRLKSKGFIPIGYQNRRLSGKSLEVSSSLDPIRLLASMLFPLCDRDLCEIANIVLHVPEQVA